MPSNPNDDEDSKTSDNENESSLDLNGDGTHKLKAHRPQISITTQFNEGDKYILVDVGGGTTELHVIK